MRSDQGIGSHGRGPIERDKLPALWLDYKELQHSHFAVGMRLHLPLIFSPHPQAKDQLWWVEEMK